jgi:hypothetical protein
MTDKVQQKADADRDAAGVDLAQAERAANAWLATAIRKLADDPELLMAVHIKIEDLLIEMRDAGLSIVTSHGGPANGLVVRYIDGSPSDIIRLGTRDAIRETLRGAADHVEGKT